MTNVPGNSTSESSACANTTSSPEKIDLDMNNTTDLGQNEGNPIVSDANRTNGENEQTGESTRHANSRAHQNGRNKQGKQSFASLFKDNRTPLEASMLTFITPPEGDVVIDANEIESVEKTFGYCLVGYVMGPRPSPYAVMNFIKGWGGNVKFLFKDNGWIKFQFPSEVDRDNVLSKGPYMLTGRQLFLKKLPSCFLYSKEDMVFLPSWVQIYGLPADCWTMPALSKIASVIGKPIHTDMLTFSKKGATYARVLVEIDAKKPIVRDYHVRMPTGIRTLVTFKYELEPKFCDICDSLGHVSEFCGLDKSKGHGKQQQTNKGKQHVSKSSGYTSGKPDIPAAPSHADTNIAGPSGTKNSDTQSVITKIQQPNVWMPPVMQHSGIAIDQVPLESHPIEVTITEKNNWQQPPIVQQASEQNVKQKYIQAYSDSDDEVLKKDAEFIGFHGDDYALDSDELEEMLSPVKTRDIEEWKTVSKKNKRFNNKKFLKKGLPNKYVDSGSSSMETECVPIDPSTKKPLKGGDSKFLKKSSDEVWLPKTASGRL